MAVSAALCLLGLTLLISCSAPRAASEALSRPVIPTSPSPSPATFTPRSEPAQLAQAPPTPTAQPTRTPIPITASPTSSVTPTATPTPCNAGGETRQTTFPSAIAGPQRAMRVYLPPCYGADGRVYPTLYILHGNIRADEEWDIIGLDEAAERGIRDGHWPPFLIVMPDGSGIGDTTSGGLRSYEAVIVDELLPAVESNYCAWPDPAGRAIGGLSRGGYWALEIAFQHPTLFASAAGHSAALLDWAADPEINPQQTGVTSDLGDLRIYLDFGADDHLIANTQQLHDDMVAAGIPHTWLLHESGGHNDAYWQAHLDEYLAWYTAPWPRDRMDYPECRD